MLNLYTINKKGPLTVGKVFLNTDCLRECFHNPIGLINDKDD